MITTYYSLQIGDKDYISGPYNVTFPIGVVRVAFNISITNDDILENNENFNVTFNPSSLPSYVTIGDPGQTIVMIVDNDCKYTVLMINKQTHF